MNRSWIVLHLTGHCNAMKFNLLATDWIGWIDSSGWNSDQFQFPKRRRDVFFCFFFLIFLKRSPKWGALCRSVAIHQTTAVGFLLSFSWGLFFILVPAWLGINSSSFTRGSASFWRGLCCASPSCCTLHVILSSRSFLKPLPRWKCGKWPPTRLDQSRIIGTESFPEQLVRRSNQWISYSSWQNRQC